MQATAAKLLHSSTQFNQFSWNLKWDLWSDYAKSKAKFHSEKLDHHFQHWTHKISVYNLDIDGIVVYFGCVIFLQVLDS